MDKYNSIFIDGIDRCGKNTLVKYIQYLSNHRYMVYDRGLLSNVTYARMFNRNSYDLEQYKPFVFVYLTCDKSDWEIRCKLTNEPPIDYDKHKAEFDYTAKQFELNGFKLLRYNTSELTPYSIAKDIISKMEAFEKPD